MAEQETQEQASTSFGDALREALSQQESTDGDQSPAVTDTAESESDELIDALSEADDEQGSEGAEASSEQDATEAVDAQQDKPAEGIAAPQTWPQERREAFDVLDDTAKDLVLGIHKDMEAGLTKSQTELADQRKKFTRFERFFDNLSNRYTNIDRNELETATMQSLPQILERYIALQSKPVETLIEIAEEMGQTSALSEQLTELDFDDNASTLRRENLRLKRELENRQYQQTEQVTDQVNSQIETFKSELTDDGVLKHPHYDAVRTTMAGLMQADSELDLEGAYQEAVRAKMPDVIEAEAVKKAREELLAKARKAKRARPNGRSGPGVPQTSEDEIPQSRREHLAQEFAKQLASSD